MQWKSLHGYKAISLQMYLKQTAHLCQVSKMLEQFKQHFFLLFKWRSQTIHALSKIGRVWALYNDSVATAFQCAEKVPPS